MSISKIYQKATRKYKIIQNSCHKLIKQKNIQPLFKI